MSREYFFEYCKGVLGAKTNIAGFKWVYGSVAPSVSRERYEACAVKFDICLKPEIELNKINTFDGKFQSYYWDNQTQTVSCRRKILGKIQIGYNITIKENEVVAEIGSNYYKLIKKRVMNLHDVYYLLSDIANLILLKNGYLTLYASGVHYSPLNKGVVCFAAPSTGKTVTAMKLCREAGYRLIGEDILIVKDRQLFACPWTSSYRGKNSFLDSTGAIRFAGKHEQSGMCDVCQLTDLITLAEGDKRVHSDKMEVLRQILILNGYVFHYYSSPIVKILGYFNPEYCKEWNLHAKEILTQLVDLSECHIIHSGNVMEFSKIVHDAVVGGA